MDFIPCLIKRLRKHRGLTVDGLATRAGISNPTIAKIEGGDSGTRLVTLEKLFEALEYPLWRAFMIEYMDEVIPAVTKAVSARYLSGKWRRPTGEPEPKAEIEEKIADFVLREIDQLLNGQLASLPRLPDEPNEERIAASGKWSKSQQALILEEITTRLTPEDSPVLVDMITAMAKMKTYVHYYTLPNDAYYSPPFTNAPYSPPLTNAPYSPPDKT
jgi:transcriptional regulator with XRE-family HTH domain